MTETVETVDIAVIKNLVKRFLETKAKKKKIILQVYKALLAIRKTESYMGLALMAMDVVQEHAFDNGKVFDQDDPVNHMVNIRNVALLFGIDRFTDTQASEFDLFLNQMLATITTNDSLEAFLVNKLGLQNSQVHNQNLVSFDDENMALLFLKCSLMSALTAADDENEINIPTHNKGFKDEVIFAAIGEFYINQGYEVRLEDPDVIVLKEGHVVFNVYTSNFSWLPGGAGRILTTINRYDREPEEED